MTPHGRADKAEHAEAPSGKDVRFPAKRAQPGARALRQALAYAQALNVGAVAVSDGCVLAASDVECASLILRLRLRVHLPGSDLLTGCGC